MAKECLSKSPESSLKKCRSPDGRFHGSTLSKASVPGHFLAPRSAGGSGHIVTTLSPVQCTQPSPLTHVNCPSPCEGRALAQPYDCPCHWCLLWLLPQSRHSCVPVSRADPMGSCSLCVMTGSGRNHPSPVVAQPSLPQDGCR